MRPWQIAHLLIVSLALIFGVVACGGKAATTSATSLPAPTPVSPVPPPSPTPTPGTSPSATVIDAVEKNAWLTCGNCGNTGATGATATYFDTLGIATPSEDGAATEFSLVPSGAYTNGYFYLRHTPMSTQLTALTYEFDLYVPAGSENTPQGIEFECQQTLNGWVYNYSWQALYYGTPGNQWRIFDYGLKRWDSTGITLTRFTPGTWHHILAEYHNDATNHLVIHDALTVDGVRTPVNITHNAFFSGSANNTFTNAVQLDGNSAGTAFNVYVNKMRITYQ